MIFRVCMSSEEGNEVDYIGDDYSIIKEDRSKLQNN
jgi:hypothetical protein